MLANDAETYEHSESGVAFGFALVVRNQSPLDAIVLFRITFCNPCPPRWIARDCEDSAGRKNPFPSSGKRRCPVRKEFDGDICARPVPLALPNRPIVVSRQQFVRPPNGTRFSGVVRDAEW